MTIELKIDREPMTDADVATIRQGLPGQRVHAQRALHETERSLAEARFGLSYDRREIWERIRRTLRPYPFYSRYVRETWVESYEGFLPDKALLRYHEALGSGLFLAFSVLEPFYGTRPPAADPWLIGWLRDHRGIVLAYWE